MYSISARLNGIFFFTFLLLGVVSIFNMLTGWQQFNPNIDAKFSVNKVIKFQPNKYYKWDEFVFTFDLEANLTSAYNWNVNQTFVYLNAEFHQNETKIKSENIIWDEIVPRVSQKKYIIALRNKKAEYHLRDVYQSLRGKNITFSLNIEITPVVGYIFRKKLQSFNYTIPSNYS